MSVLTIRIKKNHDGTAVLSCTRADGSVTWQKQKGRNASFFPQHDLTHYAVETVLRHRRGFYGLLAEGWDFSDFGAPWPRGPLPADAEPAELIVGFLDMERACVTEWPAAEMNAQAAQFFAIHRLPGRHRNVKALQHKDTERTESHGVSFALRSVSKFSVKLRFLRVSVLKKGVIRMWNTEY